MMGVLQIGAEETFWELMGQPGDQEGQQHEISVEI